MKGYSGGILNGDIIKNERGSSFYSFLGFALLAVVIIAAILIPWGDMSKVQDNMSAGREAMANKQWAKAASCFDGAIKENPENAVAYLERSKAQLQMGNLDKALADVNLAVQKEASAQSLGQRGVIKKIQKKYDEALVDLSEAIKADANYAWAYAQRADIFSKKKDNEKALKDVNKAIELKPKNVDTIRLRAWILNRMGKCKDASADFEAVLKLDPNNPGIIQDRAWFLLTCPDEKLLDSAKAMELAKKALEISGGKDGLVLETIAEAYYKQGDPLKAAEHQKKAIAIGSPKCPDNDCLKEMQKRLEKYESASRQETRANFEILIPDSAQ